MSTDRAAIILAGGHSSRMGQTKALMRLGASTMIDHVIGKVREVVKNVIVVVESPSDQLGYTRSITEAIPVVHDRIQKKSPLVGIMRGLESISASYVSVHPCDTPLIEPALLEFLFQAAIGRDAAIPITPDGIIQPLNAVYASEKLFNGSKDSLDAGELRCRNMIGRLNNVRYISGIQLSKFDPQFVTFMNVNTREDFRRLVELEGTVTR